MAEDKDIFQRIAEAPAEALDKTIEGTQNLAKDVESYARRSKY